MKYTELEQEHQAWVSKWDELTFIATSSPLNVPLSEDSKEAYRMIPFVIEQCKTAWEALPEDRRTVHFLVCTPVAS